jgi:hypothetical protein
MPPNSRFRTQLVHCHTRPFAGKCFRVVELESFLKAKTPSLLFDLGPKISEQGGRFSPPDDHRGLYMSTELQGRSLMRFHLYV